MKERRIQSSEEDMKKLKSNETQNKRKKKKLRLDK
jgi:hypothetical protein